MSEYVGVEKIWSSVATVTERNADGVERQTIIESRCKVGDPLVLRREPEKPGDPNAVGVWIASRDKLEQIGYLTPILARRIASEMDAGTAVDAIITNIKGNA